MDEFLKQLALSPDTLSAGFTFQEFLLSTALSAVLALLMSVVYRMTHTGISYSRSFVLTMIIMAITVSFIMLIIGSNLARAFSLVGALSIVRFRNAVKDSRDTANIFMVMAMGMACGTKLYAMAIAFTLITSAIMLVLDRMGFGSSNRMARLLQFSFPASSDRKVAEGIEAEMNRLTKGNHVLVSSEIVNNRKLLVFNAELPARKTSDAILNAFRDRFGNVDVKLLTGFERFNI